MLDRRQEVREALQRIRDFRWPATDSVYATVVRFNRSFELLQSQLRGRIHESEFPSVHELHQMIGSVGRVRVSWAFHDAGRPAFWDTVVKLATDGMQEVSRFPEPTFAIDPALTDRSVVFVGTNLPSNPSPDEHCVEVDDDAGSIHFQRWWELRGQIVDALRNYGYTAPEDTVASDRISFYVTEDELDDEQNVYINLGPRFSLSVDVLDAIANVLRKYDGWIAVLDCSPSCTMCVSGSGVQFVGGALAECETLKQAIDVARVEAEGQ